MATLLIDESGDLGKDFRGKSSHYFVVGGLVVSSTSQVTKILRKARLLPDVASGKILHAHRESQRVKTYLLKQIKKQKIHTLGLVLDKTKNLPLAQVPLIYPLMVAAILNIAFTQYGRIETVVIAQKDLKPQINHMVVRVIRQHSWPQHIHLRLVSPHKEQALQAADFATWAIFRSFESPDQRYAHILRPSLWTISQY